ncbi:hypothetical protein BHM03_00038573 [Ensete ventricosum]|nr:hypothetical protein BHM03_00038573 [Ensete ventricosum]
MTKSDKLEMAATRGQPISSATTSAEAVPTCAVNGSPSLSRKLSFGKKLMGSFKGGHHLRKTWSGNMKLDSEDVGSEASLSRASSASLSFSYSFTGFTALPEVSDTSRAFSNNENGNTI